MKIMEVKNRRYLSCAFLLVGILGILSSVCAYVANIPAGEMSFQYLWIGRANMLFAICGVISIIVYPRVYLYLQHVVTWSLILMGGIEVLWGISQLCGFVSSNHYLFIITGSFYNPGPYCGYLALIFPVVLYKLLCIRNISNPKKADNLICCVLCGIMILSICILLIGMSRASWCAVLISCLFVCSIHYSWLDYLKKKWYLNCHKVIIYIICLFVFLLICCMGIYYLKKDSADFIWKITSLAIGKKPFYGYGGDNFLKIYGETQEEYFKNGNYSEREKFVAGNPQYAFNEYLRIAVEYGIPVMIICLLISFYCLRKGLKRKYFGICGAILSLMFFSLFSYPLAYPSIIMTFIVLLLLTCILKNSSIIFLVFCLFIGSVGIYWENNNTYVSDKKWYSCRKLGKLCGDEFIKDEYDKLYLKLKKSGTFLFEYGICLSRLNNYDEAIKILKEAERYNCNPMILNIIGKNYQKQANYTKAEEYFIRAIHRLPERIYPYYLLAKLYVEPDYYYPVKHDKMKKIVLTKKPKIYSIAIQEMRNDLIENNFQLDSYMDNVYKDKYN